MTPEHKEDNTTEAEEGFHQVRREQDETLEGDFKGAHFSVSKDHFGHYSGYLEEVNADGETSRRELIPHDAEYLFEENDPGVH